MKKLILLVIALTFLFPTTAFAKDDPRLGIVVASMLNVRAKPTTDSAIVMTLNEQEQIEIIKERDGWLKITYPDSEDTLGWVNSKYVYEDGQFTEKINKADNPISCDEHTWVTTETYYTPAPDHIIGRAVLYAPGLMEASAVVNGFDLTHFKDGVAMPSAADLGEVVWLKRPSNNWEGPFLVVDVSSQGHVCEHVVNREQSVEVGFQTAVEWGMAEGQAGDWSILQGSLAGIEVYKGLRPPKDSQPVVYRDFYLSMAQIGDGSDHILWSIGYAKYENYVEYAIEMANDSIVSNISKAIP